MNGGMETVRIMVLYVRPEYIVRARIRGKLSKICRAIKKIIAHPRIYKFMPFQSLCWSLVLPNKKAIPRVWR